MEDRTVDMTMTILVKHPDHEERKIGIKAQIPERDFKVSNGPTRWIKSLAERCGVVATEHYGGNPDKNSPLYKEFKRIINEYQRANNKLVLYVYMPIEYAMFLLAEVVGDPSCVKDGDLLQFNKGIDGIHIFGWKEDYIHMSSL